MNKFKNYFILPYSNTSILYLALFSNLFITSFYCTYFTLDVQIRCVRSSNIFFLSLSQSYQTLISSFFGCTLVSLAISNYRQYFLMLQTLKLNNKKRKKSLFYKEKSLVGLTPSFLVFVRQTKNIVRLDHIDL